MYKGTTHVFGTDGPETEILITTEAGCNLSFDGKLSDTSLDTYRGAGAYSILLGASTGAVTANTWTDFLNTTVTSDEEMVYNSGLVGKQFTYTGSRNGVFHISFQVMFTGTTGNTIDVGVSINDEVPNAISIVGGIVPTIPSMSLSGSYLATLSENDTIKLQFKNLSHTAAVTPSILSFNFIGPF